MICTHKYNRYLALDNIKTGCHRAGQEAKDVRGPEYKIHLYDVGSLSRCIHTFKWNNFVTLSSVNTLQQSALCLFNDRCRGVISDVRALISLFKMGRL